MATRKPLIYLSGYLTELPADDNVAYGPTVPNQTPSPTLATMQPGELAIDPDTGSLVIRIGDLIWHFEASGISSYAGKLNFSITRNSHWIGALF